MIIEVNQRWSNGRAYYRPAGEPIKTREYDVAKIPDDTTARDWICRVHYSGSYVAAKERIGLYRRGELVGVAVFSVPMNEAALTNVFPKDSLDNLLATIFPKSALDNLLDLGRFAIDRSVGGNGCSFFHAECRRILAADGYVGEIAFADDVARTDAAGNVIFAGHLGTHYCASNATLISRGTARTLRLLPDGRVFSDRAASKVRSGERGWRYAARILESFGAPEAPEGDEARRIWLRDWTERLTRRLRHPGCLKYAWALDKSIKLPPSLPYPKIKHSSLQPSLFAAA